MLIQQYVDGMFIQQHAINEDVLRRLERLEQNVKQREDNKQQTVEAGIVVTKDSLRKVRDAIMNIFR